MKFKIKFRLKLRFKVAAFLIIYTVAFYYYRNSDYYNYRMLIANIDSIPWLYSTIGLIFGIISAFIIQQQWHQWNDLVDSIKGETGALYEFWLWSDRLPREAKSKIRKSIKNYLSAILKEGWHKTEEGEISDELEKEIKEMHSAVASLNETQTILSSISFSLLSNIMTYREKRIRFGSSHMPNILLSTLRLSTGLMIVLCPLIAVKTIELHYIFSISIAFLSYVVYLVATDMDHPLRPGGWHLTTSDYKKLFDKINNE